MDSSASQVQCVTRNVSLRRILALIFVCPFFCYFCIGLQGKLPLRILLLTQHQKINHYYDPLSSSIAGFTHFEYSAVHMLQGNPINPNKRNRRCSSTVNLLCILSQLNTGTTPSQQRCSPKCFPPFILPSVQNSSFQFWREQSRKNNARVFHGKVRHVVCRHARKWVYQSEILMQKSK